MNKVIVERLNKDHVKHDFDCGHSALSTYLRNIASQHERRGFGRTYVAVLEGERLVLGYYTLAASRIAYEHWPEASKVPPNMPVPTVLLGKLAVDNRLKGQKLGKFLLLHALWRAEQIAREIGAYALEVDALDDSASAFYSHHGFELLKDNSWHFFMPMERIRKMSLDFSDTPSA